MSLTFTNIGTSCHSQQASQFISQTHQEHLPFLPQNFTSKQGRRNGEGGLGASADGAPPQGWCGAWPVGVCASHSLRGILDVLSAARWECDAHRAQSIRRPLSAGWRHWATMAPPPSLSQGLRSWTTSRAPRPPAQGRSDAPASKPKTQYKNKTT